MTEDEVHALWSHPICRALQKDFSKIICLEIVVQDGEVPVLFVIRPPISDDCGGPMTQVLEQYQLTPIGSAPQVDTQDSIGQN